MESSVSSLLSSHFRCSGSGRRDESSLRSRATSRLGHAPCRVISDRFRTSSKPTLDLSRIVRAESARWTLNFVVGREYRFAPFGARIRVDGFLARSEAVLAALNPTQDSYACTLRCV